MGAVTMLAMRAMHKRVFCAFPFNFYSDGRMLSIEGAVEEETPDDVSEALTSKETSPAPPSPARNSPVTTANNAAPSPITVRDEEGEEQDESTSKKLGGKWLPFLRARMKLYV